jgi:hypothetical protein
MQSVQAITALEKLVARINAHDPSDIIALCTADHVFTDSLGSTLSGRERLKEAWAGYFSLFPDYRIEVESTVAQDTLVLACGFASATHAASQRRGTFRLHGAPESQMDTLPSGRFTRTTSQSMNCFPKRPNQSLEPTARRCEVHV